MTSEAFRFLELPIKPAIVGLREGRWVLGLSADSVGILVRAQKLPVASGHNGGNQYFFHTATLIELGADKQWMNEAIAIIRKHNQKKNKAAKHRKANGGVHA